MLFRSFSGNARIDSVTTESVEEGEDQQQVPKTTVTQDARVDDVKPVAKESVAVAVSTDDKEVIVSDEGGVTTVTTADKAGLEAPVDVVVEPEVEEIPDEEIPVEEPEMGSEDDIIMSDESVSEMVEKLFLVKYLKEKKAKLTEKETLFIKAFEALKLSEKTMEVLEAKLATMVK